MSTPRLTTAAVVLMSLALAPLPATAQGNGPAKGQGKAKPAHAQKLVPGHGAKKIATAAAPVVVVQAGRLACPPGLAKKDPACVPPGQAKKGVRGSVAVGDVVDLGGIHIVTDPGRYGLGAVPAGARYAVVDGRLVRIDSDTGKILSIIRLVDAILD